MKHIWIYGKHSAIAALENPNREVYEVRCTQNLVETVKRIRQVRISIATNEDLTKITRAVHQGILVCAKPLTLEKKLTDLSDRVLIIDRLEDVSNIGSIMRSMVALDFRCLVVGRMSNVEQAGVKSSCGAIEKLRIIQVSNIRYAIMELKRMDYTCIALDHTGKEFKGGYSKVALVLGSEGEGLSPIVKRECDEVVALKTAPDFPILNVAVAGAIGMYCIKAY